jgi:predicted nucleic acid-binding protein
MSERGPVVTNSGPLIALASVGQLSILSALYTTVLVPEAVWREVTEAGAGRPGRVSLFQPLGPHALHLIHRRTVC